MADYGVYTEVKAVLDASTEKIKLKSADHDYFEVDNPVAMQFLVLRPFYEDGGAFGNATIPLPNVKTWELTKAIEYCTRALEFGAKSAAATGDRDVEKMVKEERELFEAEFLNEVSNEKLKDLLVAVNYLEIKEMLDFLTQSMANRIRNKSVEYVRKLFDVENDFTPQEEERLRQENAWAFEGVDAD